MPSWYNLIFAVTAVAALFRFIDTGRGGGSWPPACARVSPCWPRSSEYTCAQRWRCSWCSMRSPDHTGRREATRAAVVRRNWLFIGNRRGGGLSVRDHVGSATVAGDTHARLSNRCDLCCCCAPSLALVPTACFGCLAFAFRDRGVARCRGTHSRRTLLDSLRALRRRDVAVSGGRGAAATTIAMDCDRWPTIAGSRPWSAAAASSSITPILCGCRKSTGSVDFAAIEAGIVGWSAFSLPLTALLWNMVRIPRQ